MNGGLNNKQDGSMGDLWLGIGITIGIYLIGIGLFTTLFGIFGVIVGIAAHIVLIILSFKKGRKRLGQGLLIGFGFFILLIAACFGLIFFNY